MKMSFVKNAFAALALISGAIFTSCTEEDLNTTFTPAPAEVTINAKVFNALTGKDVTAQATVTNANNGAVEYPNGVAAGTTVTVTASLNGLTASENVVLSFLPKGGKATYNVNLVLTGDQWVLVSTPVSVDEESEFKAAEGSHFVSHEGNTWFENATEYFLPVTVTYPVVNKTTVSAPKFNAGVLSADEEAAWTELAKSMNVSGAKTMETNSTKASAWSYIRAVVTYTTVTTDYTIKSQTDGTVAGTFQGVQKFSKVSCEWEEKAHPNHASHYQAGNGHNGGNAHASGNAGGGIVMPD